MGGLFNLVLSPIENLKGIFVTVGETIIEIIHLIMRFINFLPFIADIFYYITDPLKMLSDIRDGFFTGFKLIYETFTNFFFGNIRQTFNYRNINTLNQNGGSLSNNDLKCDDPKSHCYSPSFITILLLILCPPFAMLLQLGIGGIIHIIICCMLTYFFYFPGLIYASLFVL